MSDADAQAADQGGRVTISPPSNVKTGGGDTSNTPPQTSHSSPTELPTTGSEDWIEWSWSIRWDERWDRFRSTLERAKRAAASGEVDGDEANVIELGEHPARVSAGGARLGRGDKGPFMPWRFKWQGLVFMVADRVDPHKTLPSVVVRADGMACLAARSELLWHRAENLIYHLGGQIVNERLSRVDPCLDLPGVAIEPFCVAYQNEQFVSRAKTHYLTQGTDGTTIYLGGDPMLRIYDKLAEVKAKRNPIKRSLMAYHRWCGVEPAEATRVEFQLGRESLKHRGIDTVRDYFDKRSDLVHYLAAQWFRFTGYCPDRTHTTRAKTLDLWHRVQRGFGDWAGRPVGLPLDPLPRESYDITLLSKSALGCLITAAVQRGKTFESDGALTRFMLDELTSVLKDVDWRERMRKKAADFPTLE